jgi:chemotaxis protein methyltransferase CheR
VSELPLSPQVFSILNGLVEEAAGLSCSLSELEIFGSKVSARAIEAGFESLLDYYYYLRYDEAGRLELERLIEQLVVHETFFFRELEPLKVLVERCVKPLVARGQRVRIWSAACATGEEPLTLAMVLADAGLLPHVDLIASDVSARVLERAKAADYGVRTLRRLPMPAFAQPYLTVKDNRVSVSSELMSAIDWRRVNLIERASVEAVGEVDVIVCRNVLIYFREERVRQVVEALGAQLKPEGVLLIGVSESLMRLGTGLSCEELSGVFFYRKPGPA